MKLIVSISLHYKNLTEEEFLRTRDINALRMCKSAVQNKMLFKAEQTTVRAAGILAGMPASLHLERTSRKKDNNDFFFRGHCLFIYL